jgi:hypothetical protein
VKNIGQYSNSENKAWYVYLKCLKQRYLVEKRPFGRQRFRIYKKKLISSLCSPLAGSGINSFETWDLLPYC